MKKAVLWVTLSVFLFSQAAAEQLKFEELRANETIVVQFFSWGCFHMVSQKYVVRGGKQKIFTATDQEIEWRDGKSYVTPKEILGDVELTRKDVLGLDALMAFYSARIEGGCTTMDTIEMEFFRDGKLIGRDSFQDDTCATDHPRDFEDYSTAVRGKVTASVMRKLVSFGELVQRVRRPKSQKNADEPKPTSD